MPSFALSRPFIARQLRDPVGVGLTLAVPILVAGLWHLGALSPERTSVVALAGWIWTGLLPGVITDPDDPTLDLRWRTLPLGAGERWLMAFWIRLPLALIGSELLAALIFLGGPAAWRMPGVFVVAAVSAIATVSVGTAIAAWSRTSWQHVGLLGLALAIATWGAFSGGPSWAQVLPTEAARDALGVYAHGAMAWGPVLIKPLLVGLVFLVLGVIGYGRR